MPIKILLADDHAIARDAVRSLLEKHADLKVVGEAADGLTALRMVGTLLPDLILVDLCLPKLNGIELTRLLLAQHPRIRVIVVSMYGEKQHIAAALRSGASAYLLKDCASEDLTFTVRAVMKDEPALSPRVTNIVVDECAHADSNAGPSADSPLSSRERQVLQLLTEGYTTRQVASFLGVSPKTIETHRSNIQQRLHIHTIPELTKYALQQGITYLTL